MPAMSRNDMIVVCIFIIYYFLLNEVFTTFYNKLELSMIFYNIDFNNSHVKIIYLVDPVPPVARENRHKKTQSVDWVCK